MQLFCRLLYVEQTAILQLILALALAKTGKGYYIFYNVSNNQYRSLLSPPQYDAVKENIYMYCRWPWNYTSHLHHCGWLANRNKLIMPWLITMPMWLSVLLSLLCCPTVAVLAVNAACIYGKICVFWQKGVRDCTKRRRVMKMSSLTPWRIPLPL